MGDVCCPGTAVEFRYRRVGPVRSSGEKCSLHTLNARIDSTGELISRLRASSHSFSLSGSCSGNVWKVKLSSCDDAVGRSLIAFSRLKHPGKAHTRTIAGKQSDCRYCYAQRKGAMFEQKRNETWKLWHGTRYQPIPHIELPLAGFEAHESLGLLLWYILELDSCCHHPLSVWKRGAAWSSSCGLQSNKWCTSATYWIGAAVILNPDLQRHAKHYYKKKKKCNIKEVK